MGADINKAIHGIPRRVKIGNFIFQHNMSPHMKMIVGYQLFCDICKTQIRYFSLIRDEMFDYKCDCDIPSKILTAFKLFCLKDRLKA